MVGPQVLGNNDGRENVFDSLVGVRGVTKRQKPETYVLLSIKSHGLTDAEEYARVKKPHGPRAERWWNLAFFQRDVVRALLVQVITRAWLRNAAHHRPPGVICRVLARTQA